MDPAKPWLLDDAEFAEDVKGCFDDLFSRMTPGERRALWDRIVERYQDPILEAMSQLAEVGFSVLVRLDPNLKIGE